MTTMIGPGRVQKKRICRQASIFVTERRKALEISLSGDHLHNLPRRKRLACQRTRGAQLEGSHHSIRVNGWADSEIVRQTHNTLRHAHLLQRVSDVRSPNGQRDTKPTTGHPDSQHISPRGTALGALSRHSPFVVSRYPLFREDIFQPEMNDEEWLKDRESALLRLVNQIFALSDERKPSLRGEATYYEGRERLLLYYQNESNLFLYRRAQASLQFGNLSAP